MTNFTVSQSDSGKRLDMYLSEQLNTTRSQAQKMIDRGSVRVNGAVPKKTGIKLSLGDRVEVSESKPIPYTLYPIPCPAVLADTSEYLVINKPSGMVVHATAYEASGTVVDWLLLHYPKVRGVGDDPLRPGIVHRLDKDASGAMVIAKTQESFDSLKRQFKLRRVTKEYLIAVYGTVVPSAGSINLPIARAKSHSTKFVGTMAAGRAAITNYAVEESFDGYSLVRAMPETGRTHQIRVHFYSRGYPLVGDRVYTAKKSSSRQSRRSHTIAVSEGGRLMLHACFLKFRDLSGHDRAYECPPGDDFSSVLASLHARPRAD